MPDERRPTGQVRSGIVQVDRQAGACQFETPRLIVGDLDGRGLPGWRRLLVLINADAQPHSVTVPARSVGVYVLR